MIKTKFPPSQKLVAKTLRAKASRTVRRKMLQLVGECAYLHTALIRSAMQMHILKCTILKLPGEPKPMVDRACMKPLAKTKNGPLSNN